MESMARWRPGAWGTGLTARPERAYGRLVRARLLTTAVVVLLGLPGAAHAATTRYASPFGGTIGSCTSGDPCDLKTAIEGAGAGDEVVVTAGSYTLSTQV